MNFSIYQPILVDLKGRKQIAKQVMAVLLERLKDKKLSQLNVLDIGCSSGIISRLLAEQFFKVVGIDIDKSALQIATQSKQLNLEFIYMDATKINFKSSQFDVVICHQVYCCVKDPQRLFSQIFRVLKPGGVCLLAAANKYQFTKEPAGVKRVSFWQLKKLCHQFIIYTYTPKILHDPRRFNFKKLTPFHKWLNLIPESIWKALECFSPSFIWILEKP